MFKQGALMWMCGAIILAAVVIGAVTGSGFALLPAVACALMMVVMMSMMGGHDGGSGPDQGSS